MLPCHQRYTAEPNSYCRTVFRRAVGVAQPASPADGPVTVVRGDGRYGRLLAELSPRRRNDPWRQCFWLAPPGRRAATGTARELARCLSCCSPLLTQSSVP